MFLSKFLFQGRYRTRALQDAHLEALRNLELTAAQQYEHDHLYDCLSILDRKSTALIGFNSILVATSTIVLTLLKRGVSAGSLVMFGALVFAAISSAFNLFVLSLTWTDTAELADPNSHFVHLLEIRGRRSIYYRIAWGSCLISLVLVVIGIVVWRST